PQPSAPGLAADWRRQFPRDRFPGFEQDTAMLSPDWRFSYRTLQLARAVCHPLDSESTGIVGIARKRRRQALLRNLRLAPEVSVCRFSNPTILCVRLRRAIPNP